MVIRKRNIRTIVFGIIILTALSVCASDPLTKKTETYAPIEASLYHINQKVAGYFLKTGVPDGFDATQYKAAVEEVCFSNPYCKPQAEGIFDSFGIKARKVDDMFTVMLCDKELKWKVMEDFSCNNRRVEIQSWKVENKIPCDFEVDWQRVVQKHCEQ